MIVKIKGTKPNDWWLYDNIVKLHYTHLVVINIGTTDDNDINDIDVMITKKSEKFVYVGNPPNTTKVPIIYNQNGKIPSPYDDVERYPQYDETVTGTLLVVRDKNDKEFSILFDTVAYICNDEGKTIEKIFVNG